MEQRNYSIDSVRFVAICCVVILHTVTLVQSSSFPGVFLNQFSRFAVPFFFMVSGFFFCQKALKNPANIFPYLLSYGSRLLLIYLVWYVIYAAWPLYSPANWQDLANNGFVQEYLEWQQQFLQQFRAHVLYFLIAGGRGFQLWFLPSLGMGILLLAFALRFNFFTTGFLVAALLFLVALLVGPYRLSALGLKWDFEPRNGPFFSAIFVFIGAALAKYNFRLSLPAALALAIAGLGLSLLEVLLIHDWFGTPVNSHNFVIGTLFYATGICLVTLANNRLGVSIKLHELGKLTLGIYVCHILVMYFMQALGVWPAANLARFAVCLLLSALLTRALIVIPGVRKIVC